MAAKTTITHSAFLKDGSDSAFRDFIYGFLTTSSRMERIRERIGGFIGLNGLQYHIMSVITELTRRGPASVGDVARTMHAGSTHVTMETGRLVRLGLLEKTPNPDDRRSMHLALTHKGRQTMDSLIPYQQAINDALFEGLSAEEFDGFRGLIEKMLETTANALATAEQIENATDAA